jgi:hypothetical protein
MRPSLSAPRAAPPMRPGSVALNSDLASLLRDSRGGRKQQQAAARTACTPAKPTRADQKTIRCALERNNEKEVSFFLQRLVGGLYVEREVVPRGGTRTSQSVVFGDRSSFDRWFSDDPIRFRHPLLYARLKRDGDALWALDA